MKTRYAVGVAVLVVGCHLDTLLKGPGETPTGPVTGLVFASAPTRASAGDPLPAVRIVMVDSAGRTVSNADSLITVALATNPSNATLNGTDTAHAVSGVATFSDLRIDKADSGYTLRAQTTGLPPKESPAFAVMPGPATVLRFTVPPSNAMQDSVIKPPVRVAAFDSLGNAATNYSGAIRVAKGTDGSVGKNAKLGGTTSVNAVAGVATFPDLTIDQPGTGYTLTAAVGSTAPADTSDAFTIAPTPPPPPGTLTVKATTTGADLDPNGYTATLDGGASQTVAANGSVPFNNVSPGSHTVTLSDVASNCAVSGGPSQTVTVPSGGSATVPFSVTCAATTGSITVTTATSGGSQPSGYTVAVDGGGGSSQSIGVSTSVTFSGLTPGSHTVTLSGVPTNCTVTNGTSRTVTVTAGGNAPTSFSISCTALPGDLTVSTNTSGQSTPTSGYTVTLDQTTNRSIGTTDNITFTALPAGSHTVKLSGVPSNCSVTSTGGTSQTVNVPAGGSATAAFTISCTALPGSLTVSTTTSGSPAPSGYTVALDGTSSKAIGANNTVTFDNVSAGTHTVELSGVPSNCSVTSTGGTSQTVNVPAGGSGSAAFSISCTAPPGNLRVTASTSGSNVPTSGYTVTVEGTSQSISINGNVTFSGLPPGNHTAVLSGVPGNCTVTNGSSQTANVPSGGTATVGFTITCTAPPNQAPVVIAGGDQGVLLGALFSLSGASFTDPNHNGPWTVTINWGDGSSDTNSTASEGTIGGSHSYLTVLPATYTLTITVTDAGGLSGSASKNVKVGTL